MASPVKAVKITNIGPDKADALVVAPDVSLTDLIKNLPPITGGDLIKSGHASPLVAPIHQLPSRVSRPGKAKMTDIAATLTIDASKASASLADLSDAMKAMQVKMAGVQRSMLDQAMIKSLHTQGIKPINFERAAEEAYEATYRYLDVPLDAGFVVGDEEPPPLYQRWIWGPLGEFTGFALVDELFDKMHRVYQRGMGPRASFVTSLEAFLPEYWYRPLKPWGDIQLRVTAIAHPDDPPGSYWRGWSDTHLYGGGRVRGGQMLVKVEFATYRDMLRWEDMTCRFAQHIQGMVHYGR